MHWLLATPGVMEAETHNIDYVYSEISGTLTARFNLFEGLVCGHYKQGLSAFSRIKLKDKIDTYCSEPMQQM